MSNEDELLELKAQIKTLVYTLNAVMNQRNKAMNELADAQATIARLTENQ